MSIEEISVHDLAERMETGARLIDVREPNEFEVERVPGATLVPLANVADNVDAFRGDGPAYLICRSGARSMRACEFLATRGIEAVNVEGGTLAWVAEGRDVVTGAA